MQTTRDDHRNSLDALRLAAATMVLYSHQFALTGMSEPLFLGLNTYGGAGVTLFFLLSGMLVYRSWVSDPHLIRFFARRCLRIFPGLVVVVLLSVFFLGPWVSIHNPQDYFLAGQTYQYLTTAMLWNKGYLPGVFQGNPYVGAVNGSLWTLPVEFFCYVSVAFVGLMPWATQNSRIMLSLFLAVIAGPIGEMLFGHRFAPHFQMLTTFWVGVALAALFSASQYPRHIRNQFLLCFSLCIIALVNSSDRAWTQVLMLCFAASLVGLAFKFDWGARLTGLLGDLSYGVYIYAFPVQQTVVYLGLGRGWSFEWHLVLSVLATYGLAWLSWHVVEKPALRIKPKQRVVA